jgi:hypothetical protein
LRLARQPLQKAVVSFLGQLCEVCIDEGYALDAGH